MVVVGGDLRDAAVWLNHDVPLAVGAVHALRLAKDAFAAHMGAPLSVISACLFEASEKFVLLHHFIVLLNDLHPGQAGIVILGVKCDSFGDSNAAELSVDIEGTDIPDWRTRFNMLLNRTIC